MTTWREADRAARWIALKGLRSAASVGWTEWLSSHVWQTMVTHTFVDHVGADLADRMFRRWVREGQNLTGRTWRWARASEYQKRGVLHYHSLIDGWLPHHERLATHEVIARRDQLDGLWHCMGELAGFQRMHPISPARVRYVCKYVAKGGDLEVGGDWTQHPENLGLVLRP